MMKKMMKTTCALAVLAASCNVMAESVDMRVIGAVTPVACKPELSDNGVVDFGNINSNALNKDEITFLPTKNIKLSINCSAPAKVALLATNARPGSTLGATAEGPAGTAKPLDTKGMGNGGVAGLGMDGDKKIGAYGMVMIESKLDGVGVENLRSNDRNSWSSAYADSFFDDRGTYKYLSWYQNDVREPVAFKNMTATITFSTYVNKASELDLSKPIKIDGLANIEMFYL